MVGGARIMDPMLSKLCELWELDVADESSLSHLLPSTKYAWGSEAVRSSPPTNSSLCYTDGLQAPPSESPGSDRRFCGQCESANRDDANWCTECGSAIVGATALSEKLLLQCDSGSDTDVSSSCSPDIICPQLLDEVVDRSMTASPEFESLQLLPETFTPLPGKASIKNGQCPTVNYPNVCDSPVIHGVPWTVNEQANSVTKPVVKSPHASQPFNVRHDSSAVRVKNTSPVVTENYQRHWNTSAVHMWRKPSSIQKSSQRHETLLGDLPSGHANLVKQSRPTIHRNTSLIPLIDLSAIQSRDLGLTTESISTRTSFSIQNIPLGDVVNLLFLPDEIILMVLSNLSHRDLANCMLVCKRLFHIASDATLWRNIQVQKFSGVCEEYLQWLVKKQPTSISFQRCTGTLKLGAIQRFFSRITNSLKVFEMSLCNFGVSSNDMMFLSAAQYCPKVCNITVNWCTISQPVIVKGFQAFSRLEEVSLEQQGGGFCNDAIKVLIKRHGKTLRKIDVGSSDSNIVMSHCGHQNLPNLISFAGTFLKMNESTFKTIAFVFPKLKELTIRHYVESAFNHEITKQLPNERLQLESLSLKLSNPCALRPISCTHINQMISLRTLVLDCVNDEGLQTLCMGKLKLRFLDLSQSGITDKSFSLIGRSSFATTLTHVRMSKCHGIDSASSKRVMANLKQGQLYERTLQQVLKEFIQQCKRLRVVDLMWLYCTQNLKLEDFRPCMILVN